MIRVRTTFTYDEEGWNCKGECNPFCKFTMQSFNLEDINKNLLIIKDMSADASSFLRDPPADAEASLHNLLAK